MRERLLGRSGIRVSELCLGTMTFGTEWDMRHAADENTSRRMYEAFREAGGNFIDTANVYGSSEEILGRLLDRRARRRCPGHQVHPRHRSGGSQLRR